MKEIIINDFKLSNIDSKNCIPISGQDFECLEKEILYALDNKADIIEWRCDFYKDIEDKKMIDRVLNIERNIPMILTFRSYKEGGYKKYSDHIRLETIKHAIQSKKVDFIDIELDNENYFLDEVRKIGDDNNIYIILSNHDFEKTPSYKSIMNTFNNMQKKNTDIYKVAYTPETNSDVIRLLKAVDDFNIDKQNLMIGISMKQMGVMTRLFANTCGSCLTFVAGLGKSAPGQISIENMTTIKDSLQIKK